MKFDPSRLAGVWLAVVLVTVGCSGPVDSPTQPAQPAVSQPAEPPSAYTGPDEFTLREQYLPVLQAQQQAAEEGLGEVAWLAEPAFQYRQSMNNSVVASLHVVGTTEADTDRADAWLQRANQQLAGHGFDTVADLTQDAGGGLLIISPSQATDACFTARWGQGSVALTVEVGATDVQCS